MKSKEVMPFVKPPPMELDGGQVLVWAWSEKPFGYVPLGDGGSPIAIHGLAVIHYPGDKHVYRLSCDAQWESVMDSDADSVEEALQNLPAQYRLVKATWHAM